MNLTGRLLTKGPTIRPTPGSSARTSAERGAEGDVVVGRALAQNDGPRGHEQRAGSDTAVAGQLDQSVPFIGGKEQGNLTVGPGRPGIGLVDRHCRGLLQAA